jgi:hypothetical protein
MIIAPDAEFIATLEDGFVPVPISEAEAEAAIALCVVVRRQPDAVAGHFVILRRFPAGLALLGALRDAGGRIVEWLELWVPSRGEGADSVARSNAGWDEAWTELDRSVQVTDPAAHLRVAALGAGRRPVFLDVRDFKPWHPAAENAALVLCADNAALEAAGLPGYSLSAARFAWVPGRPESLTALNPEAERAGRPPLALPRTDGTFVPLNAECWPVIVRTFAPLSVGDFAALLGGQPWRGDDSALKPCRLNRAYRELSDLPSMRCGGRHYFSNRRGAAGLLAETLHLKLHLAAQAMEVVRDYVSFRQLPLLNLTAESLRVRIEGTAAQLPILWTARVSLVVPGDAVPLAVPNTRERFFRPRLPLRESIYRPEELTRPRSGLARVRLRAVLPPNEEGVVVEATITTPEELRVDRHELIEVALPLADGTIRLYGYLDSKVAMARGESGFRSIPLQLSEKEAAALRGAAGVIFTQVPMEVQVPLSSPCDLYSLGVLALQFLFAGSAISLPVAKDSLFSLAAQVAAEFPETDDLAKAIEQLVERDPRWLADLGPQHLAADELGAAEATDLIPMKLWSRVLAVLLRLFPRRSPFAFCKDFGDAPPLALHAVFDRALEPLGGLVKLTRSLHVVDWKQNREIVSLIEKRKQLA